MTSHDHGNCGACDLQSAEIARLKTILACGRCGRETVAGDCYGCEADRLRAEVEQLTRVVRLCEEGDGKVEAERNEALAQVDAALSILKPHVDEATFRGYELEIPTKARALLTRLERAERVAEALRQAPCVDNPDHSFCMKCQALTAWQEARDAS